MEKTNASTTTKPSLVIGAIQHVELMTPDAAKLRKFLEKQFGWAFETTKTPVGDYHLFRTANGSGGGIMTAQPGMPTATVPYINVVNLQETLKNVQKAGATIVTPATEVPGMGGFFQFRYADGPVLACWQQTGPVR